MYRNQFFPLATFLVCFAASPLQAQIPGSLDPSFDPASGQTSFSAGAVSAIVLPSASAILVAGDFTVGGVPHVRLVRLNANGNVDGTFSTITADNELLALGIQSDEKLLVAGRFSKLNNSPVSYVGRLNPDGTVDPGFSTNGSPNFDVAALAIQPDGKILLGGSFDAAGSAPRNGLARLNSDGSLDATFDPKLDEGSFIGVILQQSNKIIVSQLLNDSTTVRRLNNDGSADNTFNSPLLNGEVFSMATQLDGKLVVAGSFQKVGDIPRKRIARLSTDGTLDPSFDPGAGADADILSLVIQPDQKIIGGGNFAQFNNIARAGVARLLSAGGLDAAYNQGAGVDGAVTAMALQPDGKLLVGGFISAVDGVARDGIARLLGDVADQPTGPLLTDPSKTGITFSVSFQSVVGKTYTLEFAPVVTGQFSAASPSLVGNGSNQTLSDPAASAHLRFYRVRVD